MIIQRFPVPTGAEIAEDLYPHGTIVNDMIAEVLGSVALTNRRIYRAVLRYGEQVFNQESFLSSVYLEPPAVPSAPKDQLMLKTPEDIRDTINQGATRVGTSALRAVCEVSGFPYYRGKLSVEGFDERLSCDDFVRQAWVPDYTDRFVAASPGPETQIAEAIK